MGKIKKCLIVGALSVAVLFSATGCNKLKTNFGTKSQTSTTSSSTNSYETKLSTTHELDESHFPKLEEHLRTRYPSALDEVPADFFTSKSDYTQFIDSLMSNL